MKVETEIKLAEDLIPSLLNGKKRVTIRKGHRIFSSEITIAGHSAIVESTEHLTLETCPFEILLEDGFSNFKEVEEGMSRFYPDINLKTPITVLRFHLCIIPTD